MHVAFLFMAFSIQISNCFKWLWWDTYKFMNVFFITCSPLVLKRLGDCFLLGWKRGAWSEFADALTLEHSFSRCSSLLFTDLLELSPQTSDDDKNKCQIPVLEYNYLLFFWLPGTYKNFGTLQVTLHHHFQSRTDIWNKNKKSVPLHWGGRCNLAFTESLIGYILYN